MSEGGVELGLPSVCNSQILFSTIRLSATKSGLSGGTCAFCSTFSTIVRRSSSVRSLESASIHKPPDDAIRSEWLGLYDLQNLANRGGMSPCLSARLPYRLHVVRFQRPRELSWPWFPMPKPPSGCPSLEKSTPFVSLARSLISDGNAAILVATRMQLTKSTVDDWRFQHVLLIELLDLTCAALFIGLIRDGL